uniref:ATP-dependent DNA helicase n=1 Tax=Amphimedon queenslandica TaxID=400682 RepID=A0A1X7U4N0_AMPQE
MLHAYQLNLIIIEVPCDIERVTSRFMLSKNLYLHRKEFSLILFYAITIHKCQGLSLNTAIIDLSTNALGMLVIRALMKLIGSEVSK